VGGLGPGPPEPPLNPAVSVCTTCEGSSESEILRRICIARNCMMLLEKHIWKSHIWVGTKVRLYSAIYVIPVLVFGSEVWTITKALTQRLEAFDMVTLKNSLDLLYKTCYAKASGGRDYRVSCSFPSYYKDDSVSLVTFRSQTRSPSSYQCVASATRRLEETSRTSGGSKRGRGPSAWPPSTGGLAIEVLVHLTSVMSL